MVRNHSLHSLFWSVLSAVLLLTSCVKMVDSGPSGSYENPAGQTDLAVGTLRSRDGVRFIQLDAFSAGFIVNPNEVRDLQDDTRVFVQYRYVVYPSMPDFCSDAILVEWATPLDVGEIRFDMQASPGDPVSLILDWITSLEDGFLTLHYDILASGKVQHDFSLYPTVSPYRFRLVHDAHGDTGGSRADGIICFPVGDLLPEDTGDGSVTLSLTYLDLEHIQKTLTIEYRSPK